MTENVTYCDKHVSSRKCIFFCSATLKTYQSDWRGLGVLSSRGIRWRRGLLSWISASLTRRTVVTATGTGLTNPCPSKATGSISHFSIFTVWLREVIACLHYLFDFTVWLPVLIGFILSSIPILTTKLLLVFVLSLYCILDYGLLVVVYLPLHIN